MNVARTAIGLATVLASLSAPAFAQTPASVAHPQELVALTNAFRDWRGQTTRETVDYGVRVAAQRKGVAEFRQKLDAFRTDGWATHAKVDYLVLRSEIDDLGFDLDVIRQVSRNPDFYVTEAATAVSRHIGGRYQTAPGVPVAYDAARASAIVAALNGTPAIIQQAPKLLTEGVGEMADMAIERLEDIQARYAELAKVLSPHVPEGLRPQLSVAAAKAGDAMAGYRTWLQANRAKMTAPVPIGKAAFEWYARNVMFMPYNSEQLLMQAEMERLRGWAFLQMEKQRNRHLPPLRPAQTNHEYSEWKDATDVLSRLWADEYQLFTAPALGPMRDRDGGVWIEPFGMIGFPAGPIAKGEKVAFLVAPDHWFSKIYWEIGHRLDPGTNHPHSDYPGHTFERAVSASMTCELRRDHRTRGDAWTYYMEDVQLQMDYPFVRGPRVREWMWSLLIMRAERVYAAVKFAAGELTPEQVEEHFLKTVPGMEPHVAKKHEVWRKFVDPAQVLTYQVGRMQVYQLMKDRALQLGDKFDLKAFNDALLATGQIPVSLARWELTGLDDE
ncbi:MAG: DUF885 family protein, partial [Vicinamibacteraceae bacterium]